MSAVRMVLRKHGLRQETWEGGERFQVGQDLKLVREYELGDTVALRFPVKC